MFDNYSFYKSVAYLLQLTVSLVMTIDIADIIYCLRNSIEIYDNILIIHIPREPI